MDCNGLRLTAWGLGVFLVYTGNSWGSHEVHAGHINDLRKGCISRKGARIRSAT